jgi:cell division ATPase FtsA
VPHQIWSSGFQIQQNLCAG